MMGMATTPTAQANATMPLSSSSLASLSLLLKHFFYFFERKEKKKLKVVVRQCSYKEMLPNWQLYSQDLTN